MNIGNKTQIFQPLRTPLANKSSYYKYCWKHNLGWSRIVRAVMLAASIISLILDVADFFSGSGIFLKVLFLVGLLGPAIFSFLDFVKHYDEKFTSIETVPGAYDDVEPPDIGWNKKDIMIPGKREPVYTCEKLDNWLRTGQEIGIVRDREYEKRLRGVIRNEDAWNNIYAPFLRHNHFEAMYMGKQFYNESKFGLSAELDIGALKAKVHRSCYFDTYLTNIIPGKTLISNRDGTVVAETIPNLMPYQIDTNGVRRLCMLGEKQTSNELGVTTLCILSNGYLRLWRQNRMAQCSTDLIVASGSGSADWNDCKKYFNDPNGLRKAIIHGMERELWEESNGTRDCKMSVFKKNVDTRIIGYFRWLTKGGKSEFVGVSRLRDISLVGNLSPEKSEVNLGTDLPARTMRELINSLVNEIDTTDGGQTFVSKRCNVSCSMAILALQSTCRLYCRNQCPNFDMEKGCCKDKCNVKPFNALFSEIPIVHT